MRKIDIQELIQLLGMVGSIGSLKFVGLEMRQSQRIALAGQQALRTQFFLDGVDALSEPQKSNQTLIEMLLGDIPVTEDYEWVVENGMHRNWWIFENDFVHSDYLSNITNSKYLPLFYKILQIEDLNQKYTF